MNYLAHSLLSCGTSESIVGAMLGDFVKGPVGEEHPAAVREAILLHRAIDRYTDAHPLYRASCARIDSARRRFAPVLIDLFYDHFLARHWSDYCPMPLPKFSRRVYDILLANEASLPPRLQVAARRMAASDWFSGYAEIEGIASAVNGIAYRLRRYRRAAILIGAVTELEREYLPLERDFGAFFPELGAHVDGLASERQAA